MMTPTELKKIKDQINEEAINRETVLKLVTEIERLKKYIADYTQTVTGKILAVENNLDELEIVNNELLAIKNMAFVERDACIGLLSRFAVKTGLSAGIAPGNIVIVDLPSGQVSWEYNESESHLFSGLPAYPAEIEDMPIEEKYRRVMNSGIIDLATTPV